jgi:hypothetical protein
VTLLFDGTTERGELVIAGLKCGESIGNAAVPKKPFVCGVMLTDPSWTANAMSSLTYGLMGRGAVYLAFWGVRCEEAHDIADRVREQFTPADSDDVVITTWHSDESLVDYLWFVAFVACPTPGYCKEGMGYLMVDVGEGGKPDMVSAVREVFVS